MGEGLNPGWGVRPFIGRVFKSLSSDTADSRADLARSSATVLLLIIASALLGFGSQVALTRSLGAMEYGRYAVAISWALIVAAVTMAGLDGSIIRFAAEYAQPGRGAQLRRFAKFITLVQLAAIALVGAVILAVPFSMAGIAVRSSEAIWIIAYIASTALLASLSSFFTAFRLYLFGQLYQNLLRPALLIGCIGIWALMLGRMTDAEVALELTALTSFIVLAPFVLHLALTVRRYGNGGSAPLEARRWLVFSGWVQFGNICNQAVVQVPTLIIGTLASPTEAGYYAVAARVSALVTMGLSAVGAAIGPMISRAYAIRDFDQIARLARTAARLGTSLSLAAAVGLAIGGAPFMSLFGKGFSHAYIPLMVLLCGGIFNAFTGVNAILLAMTDQPKFAVQSLVLGAAINVVSSCVLVKLFGAAGGAAGVTIGALVSNGLMVVRARQTLGIDSTALGLAPKPIYLNSP